MNRIIALDVETPNRYNDRICALGVTIINEGMIKDSLYYLVNPETEFDIINISIHGIKPVDVLNAPIFPDVWKEIAELFNAGLIVAHNATFDLCVLRKTLHAYGIIETTINYACTMQIARSAFSYKDYKLSTLCDFHGIELHHHNAQSDSHCCAQLLGTFLSLGVTLDNYINTFDLSDERVEKTHTLRKKTLSDQNQSIKALKDIITAITCDALLVEEEIMFLQNWLNENRELEGNYPFNEIFDTVSNALMDGVLERHELEDMLKIFNQVLDPVGSQCLNCNSLDLENKIVVLTGDFERGDRRTIELDLAALGAICKKTVSKQTDFLIVGGQGSSMWCADNYGSKVKKALELQASGVAIQIIKEEDFFAVLNRTV